MIILCTFTIFMFVYLPSELWSMLYDLFVYGLGEGGLRGKEKNFGFRNKIKQRWDFIYFLGPILGTITGGLVG